MGLQAIEAEPKDGSPAFLVDRDTGDMTATHWAVVQRLFQREGTSIAFSPTHWLPGFKTVRDSYGTSRVVVRASVTVGACVLWLFIGAVGDNGLCGESNTRAQAFVAPTEDGRKIAQPNDMRDETSLVSRVVETTVVEQKQILERSREKIDMIADWLTPIQGSDAAQGKAAQATPAVSAWERTHALEHAEALARALTSSLRAELDALRSAAEAARIKQRQALDQERERADALARELTSLRAELDAARRAGTDAAQAAAAEAEQKQALEQERDRAEALGRELTSLRAELDTARAQGGEALRTAEAAKIEQELAIRKERDKTETLTRELASVQKNAEEHSARLAAAYAEVLRTTETNSAIAAEQKRAVASERDRADALARELASARNALDAGNWQAAALNAFRALHVRESPVDSSQERIVAAFSRTERNGRSTEQISGEAVASASGRSSASELPRPEGLSADREAASDLGQKVAVGTERSTSGSGASHSPVDEQRLLARANELLRQADISGAPALLECTLEHGIARAAFMLAETYDPRMLQSWRPRGISGDPTKARELHQRAPAAGLW